MVQRLLVWLIILVSILWVVVSYLPKVQAALPTVAFADSRWLMGLAIAGLVTFLVLQLWVVKTTAAAIRRYHEQPDVPGFDLRLSREIFWTALPILMTVGLAWASLDLWRNLAIP